MFCLVSEEEVRRLNICPLAFFPLTSSADEPEFPDFLCTYCLSWLICRLIVRPAYVWASDQRWHCVPPAALRLCSSGFLPIQAPHAHPFFSLSMSLTARIETLWVPDAFLHIPYRRFQSARRVTCRRRGAEEVFDFYFLFFQKDSNPMWVWMERCPRRRSQKLFPQKKWLKLGVGMKFTNLNAILIKRPKQNLFV